MSEINNIHDTFFRETMSHKEVAADFLANYLPAPVLEFVQLETLSITKDTFVDRKQAAHYSDLLYQVKLAGDRPGFVYFLFVSGQSGPSCVALMLPVKVWEV